MHVDLRSVFSISNISQNIPYINVSIATISSISLTVGVIFLPRDEKASKLILAGLAGIGCSIKGLPFRYVFPLKSSDLRPFSTILTIQPRNQFVEKGVKFKHLETGKQSQWINKIATLSDEKITKYCKFFEKNNSLHSFASELPIDGCSKVANAIFQLTGKKFYNSSIVGMEGLSSNQFEESLRNPEAHVYMITFSEATFQNEDISESLTFPGHAMSVIQFSSESNKNSPRRYLFCQSFIGEYTLESYMEQEGKTLLTLEELKEKFIHPILKIGSHTGPWTQDTCNNWLTITGVDLSDFEHFSPSKEIFPSEKLPLNFYRGKPGSFWQKTCSLSTCFNYTSNLIKYGAVALGVLSGAFFTTLLEMHFNLSDRIND
jgi:hypothetical protein